MLTDVAASRLILPTFTGISEDYLLWKKLSLNSFSQSGVTDCLADPVTQSFSALIGVHPTTGDNFVITSSEQLRITFMKNCDVACGHILAKLDAVSFQHVESLDSPFAIFNELDGLHVPKTHLSRINILTQLLDRPQSDTTSPKEHCDAWTKLIITAKANGINDTEIKIDDMLNMLFLNFINPKYESCVSAFQRQTVPLKISEMSSEMTAMEER